MAGPEAISGDMGDRKVNPYIKKFYEEQAAAKGNGVPLFQQIGNILNGSLDITGNTANNTVSG